MKKQIGLIVGILVVAVIGFVAFNYIDNDDLIAEMTDESVAAGASESKEDMMEETKEMMEETKEMMEETEEMMEETKEMMETEAMMMNDGEMAPAFKLESVSGEMVSLESFKGEKVYVKFWASWCSICLAGLEEFDELSANAEGYRVISIVSPDYNGEQSREDFIKWFKGLGYENIVVLLDDDGEVSKEFGVRGYPTSAYIGSDGVLVKIMPGHVSNEAIAESFESIY